MATTELFSRATYASGTYLSDPIDLNGVATYRIYAERHDGSGGQRWPTRDTGTREALRVELLGSETRNGAQTLAGGFGAPGGAIAERENVARGTPQREAPVSACSGDIMFRFLRVRLRTNVDAPVRVVLETP